MPFDNLYSLIDRCKCDQLKKIVVVCPYADDTLGAAVEAFRTKMAVPIFVGQKEKILSEAANLGLDLEGIQIIEAENDEQAVELSVKLVSSGQADLLMKGLVKTATLLKAVLNKEWGLRTGSLLSHVMITQPKRLGRPICITDGGMNMYPDVKAKVGIINNAVSCYHALGVENPKVAVLAAVEVVNPDMQATLDAQELTEMNQRGEITGCIVNGPLALDNAVSEEAAAIKGITSPVAGHAEILVVPSIEAGNMLGKSALFLAHAPGAGIIMGAAKPIVMTSRFDTMESKLLSIALGACIC